MNHEKDERVVDKLTVAISRETANRLKKLGRYGDTMETIILRILDEYERIEAEKSKLFPKLVAGGALTFLANAMRLSLASGRPVLFV